MLNEWVVNIQFKGNFHAVEVGLFFLDKPFAVGKNDLNRVADTVDFFDVLGLVDFLDTGSLVQRNTEELVQVDERTQILGLVVQKRMVNQLISRGLSMNFKRKTFAQKVLAVGTKIIYDLLVNNNIVIGNKLV